jgi:hypothetical protein
VTIIKTISNSVFGGFTSALWKFDHDYGLDAYAFIFSLRRSGNSNKERFNITQPNYAKRSYYNYGPTFGHGHDIYVSDYLNSNEKSYNNFGHGYQLPKYLTYDTDEAHSYLAGSYYWKTSEIEVYQVKPYIPYFGTLLHNGCLF